MGSIWTGASGLITYSDAIGVVANNLANTNTTGFKASRTLFSDLISSAAGGTCDGSQVGKGSTVGSVSLTTGAGSLQSSSSSLDMAIDGEDGYFQVHNPTNDGVYYTRDGAFNFNIDGYLTNAQGMQVLGWAVDADAMAAADAAGTSLATIPVTGDVTDIRITNFTMPAKATSEMSVITNLDSDTDPNVPDATDPYFTMFKNYDATSDTPTVDADYSTSVTVYDAQGAEHDLTVYYNKVSTQDGKQYWEYMVAMDPSEDGNATTAGTSKAGVLMIGTMTFSSDGTLENQTAYGLSASATDPTALSSWGQASLNANGIPQLSATFVSSNGSALPSQTITCNLGLSTTAGAWSASNPATADGIGSNATFTAGFDTAATKRAATATTNYATSSSTLTSSADGYASGKLSSAYVNDDGVIYGTYSNGQQQPLWVLALANFTNPAGLVKEGNNLYSAGDDSGAMTIGRANTGVFDSVSGNYLEASNVDLGTEMVNLILFQRAFESNSKVVTTADAMMQKALEIKR